MENIRNTKINLKSKKKVEKRILKKISAPYSLKNNKTKATLEYSILNPLTSSLSPSEKSNGARLSSANIIKIKGIIKKIKPKLKKGAKENFLK